MADKSLKEITKGLTGERLEKTLAYRNSPKKLGRERRSTYNPNDEWDYGLEPEMTTYSGLCPCSVCGHRFNWECEEANCHCCSSSCC